MWQKRARDKEWPEQDIKSIEDILKIGKDTSAVTRVTYASITIATTPHGESKAHSWKWHRVDVAEPKFAKEQEPIAWCAFHGRKCGPTLEGGCGEERVVFFIPCECPSRGHFHDCDAYLRQVQDKEDAEKKKAIAEPPAPAVERKQKYEKPKAVQMRLDVK